MQRKVKNVYIPVYLCTCIGFCMRRDAMQKACFSVSDDTVQHTLIRGQCQQSARLLITQRTIPGLSEMLGNFMICISM